MAVGFHRIWCDECAVEISWTPVMIDGRPYCCHDCAVGLECNCASIDQAWEDDNEPLWLRNIESSRGLTYGLDYGFD